MVWCEGGSIPRVVSVLVFFDIKARSWNFWHALRCVLYDDGDGGLTSLRRTETVYKDCGTRPRVCLA
jgi:hypothetical protein